MPLHLDFVTLDVFTRTMFKGNPLVILKIPHYHRARLTQDVKQRIAREFNHPVTVFLHLPSPGEAPGRVSIDVFSIEHEITFAGHAIIGIACLIIFETSQGGAGIHTILTKFAPFHIGITSPYLPLPFVYASIPQAVHVHDRTLGDALQNHSAPAFALCFEPRSRHAELLGVPVSIFKGMTFVLVELPDLAALSGVTHVARLPWEVIRPDLLNAGDWNSGFVARYYYVVLKTEITDGEAPGQRNIRKWAIRSRMVERRPEDPATDAAACALAAYLSLMDENIGEDLDATFLVTQGVEMGRESRMMVRVSVEAGGPGEGERKIKTLTLGGTAMPVTSGTMTVAA